MDVRSVSITASTFRHYFFNMSVSVSAMQSKCGNRDAGKGVLPRAMAAVDLQNVLAASLRLAPAMLSIHHSMTIIPSLSLSLKGINQEYNGMMGE